MEIFFYVPVFIIAGLISIPVTFYFIRNNKSKYGNNKRNT